MKLKTRNIVALSLMMLILFSTIGFNIISTFCDGCEIEHTSIAIVHDEDNLDCDCCQPQSEKMSCCSTDGKHSEEHHQSKSTFAHLKIDAPVAKAEKAIFEAPSFILFFVSQLLSFELFENFKPISLVVESSPPLTGRQILSLICILRN